MTVQAINDMITAQVPPRPAVSLAPPLTLSCLPPHRRPVLRIQRGCRCTIAHLLVRHKWRSLPISTLPLRIRASHPCTLRLERRVGGDLSSPILSTHVSRPRRSSWDARP